MAAGKSSGSSSPWSRLRRGGRARLAPAAAWITKWCGRDTMGSLLIVINRYYVAVISHYEQFLIILTIISHSEPFFANIYK